MTDPESVDIERITDVADEPVGWPVRAREVIGKGRLFDYLRDVVVTPSGEEMVRDYIDHSGAVAVIAVDDEDCVVVVHQYRHPVGLRLIEPPAGLLDLDGEAYLVAAQRELAEEAGLAADDWRVLIDYVTTPGGVSESIRIFLARGLRSVPRPEGFVLEGEEAHMSVHRAPLDDLVTGILAGRLQSPTLVSGCLALAAARGREDQLRPADAPWPAREAQERLRAAYASPAGGSAGADLA